MQNECTKSTNLSNLCQKSSQFRHYLGQMFCNILYFVQHLFPSIVMKALLFFLGDHLKMFLKNMRTRYGKATGEKKGKSGAAPPVLTDHQNEIIRRWGFLKDHITRHVGSTAGVSTNEWKLVCYNIM